MKLSYSWLKDYVDVTLSPKELAILLTMSGLTIDSTEEKDGDTVFEVEITSNRPDWLSYIGIAREVAALTGRKLKLPYSVRRSTHNAVRSTISVKVEDRKLCPRYTACAIKNVKVGESPAWLKKKIEAMGLRPVNNIVDITNFCLFETGEPMHAFDLDKLKGQSIIVRKASKGEKMVAIDGIERSLGDSTLVIADEKEPIAIAGVMGGLSAEVSARTKNILLEAACFDPISVRRTSRKLALSSESSYRFERKVNIDNIVNASMRATGLILKLAGGEAVDFIDVGSAGLGGKVVGLKYEKLNKIMGLEIAPGRAKKILTSLGLKVKASSKKELKLETPGFRYDLENEIDLIEEVARIYGYGKVPETIPAVVEKGERFSAVSLIFDKVRCMLSSLGLCEVITHSLLSKKLLEAVNSDSATTVEIKNPLSAEQEVMRPTLIAGMLGSIRWNINRRSKDLKLFEIGKAYLKSPAGGFTEEDRISIALTGHIHDGWMSHPRQVSFFDLKGIVETLLQELGIHDLSVKEAAFGAFAPSASAVLGIKGERLGIVGQVSPGVLNSFDIKEPVYIAEIDIEKIMRHASCGKHFKELQKYPSVLRDISIVINKNKHNADIITVIKQTAGSLLKEIKLVDRYFGGQIPDGKVGLTYRLEYQDINRTLEDKEVTDIHSLIVRALESDLAAHLR